MQVIDAPNEGSVLLDSQLQHNINSTSHSRHGKYSCRCSNPKRPSFLASAETMGTQATALIPHQFSEKLILQLPRLDFSNRTSLLIFNIRKGFGQVLAAVIPEREGHIFLVFCA